LRKGDYRLIIYKQKNEYADIWLTYEENDKFNYCYGGSRSIPYNFTDREAETILNYLGSYESGLKNELINHSIKEGVFEEFKNALPANFTESCVGGGRCVIRPKSQEIEKIMSNPEDSSFHKIINSILADVGCKLNQLSERLKLTPDFGRFAGVADILNQYTDHVLGIRCENGGCGGKASYTSTGINAAIDYFLEIKGKNSSIVLIGADGACGEGVFNYLLEKEYNLVGVSDLDYNINEVNDIPVLRSEIGRFTDECLASADIIVATTVGNEFLNSNIDIIKPGTIILLTHNNCLPYDEDHYE
jgi:hypothetical protein